MFEYKLTKKAVEDLSNIWKYTIEIWSEEQADRYYNLLLDRCRDIDNHPEIGKSYENLANDLFGLKSFRHIIFYRKLVGNSIEITRILHEHMDLKNKLKSEE